MEKKIPIQICTGTACYILGGSQYLLIKDELDPEILEKVEISGSPCMGLCRRSDDSHTIPCIQIGEKVLQGLSKKDVITAITEYVKVRG